MSSSHSWLASALGAWLLCCTPLANAQDAGLSSGRGGIAVNPISIGGEEVNTLEEILRLGIDECVGNETVLFDLDNIPDKRSIAVFVGDGCNSTDRTNTDLNRCTLITSDTTNNQTRDLQFEIGARELFGGSCEVDMEVERTFWFLAVNDPAGSEAVGNGYGTIDIDLDGRAPDAPTNIRGGSGERQIRVDWETDEADLEGFVIYIDPGTGVGGGGAGSGAPDDDAGASSNVDCGSGLLISGSEAPDPDDFEQAIELNESTATGETLSPEQIGGTRAAIAVAAVDLAGNRSPLSDLACVSVMPTESFWDRYEANGGDAKAGCPCSALGAVHVHTAWPVALALLFVRRAARRRRQP
jgi:hypothetical protein